MTNMERLRCKHGLPCYAGARVRVTSGNGSKHYGTITQSRGERIRIRFETRYSGWYKPNSAVIEYLPRKEQ